MAKTSLQQTWHKPRGNKIQGTTVESLTLFKQKKADPESERRPISSTLYNPIRQPLPPVGELNRALTEVSPDMLFLTIQDPTQAQTATKFGFFPKGSALSYQQSVHPANIINIMNIVFPELPCQNLMCNTFSGPFIRTAQAILDNLEVTQEDAQYFEEQTRSQSEEPLWHNLRKSRVTASQAGEIFKRRRNK